MPNQQVDVVAVITPAPGKKERVQELLLGLTKAVYTNEPDTLRYTLLDHEATGEFVVIERYATMAAFQSHKDRQSFLDVVKAATEENLPAKPLDIKELKRIGGHDSR